MVKRKYMLIAAIYLFSGGFPRKLFWYGEDVDFGDVRRNSASTQTFRCEKETLYGFLNPSPIALPL